jgi:sigma-B regulation protein RsbQ
MQRDPISRNNVTVSGNLNAPQTLLFAHGMGTDQAVWKQITSAFEADYKWVSFDNVGAVESNQADFRSRSFHYLNINGYASDLLEICSALKLSGNTNFIGHSIGAMAGLIAATQRPGQFKALVLLGVSPCYQNVDGYEGGFTKEDIDKTYEALASDYPAWTKAVSAAAMGNPDQPQLAEHFAQTMARVPKEMMLTVLCSILQMDHRSDLPKVAVPVLLIQSHKDIFVPLGVASYLQANIPDCQLKVIDAMGHLPHVSASDKVIEAIRDFLSSNR